MIVVSFHERILEGSQMSTDLRDHGFSLLVRFALAFTVLGLGVDDLTSGLDHHLKVASGTRIAQTGKCQLTRELVLKRYCESIEVALNYGEKD